MKKELRQLIKGTPAIMAKAKSCDWGGAPQGKPMPTIILRKVGGSPANGVRGPDVQHGALVRADIWATTYDAANEVSELLKAAISGHTDAAFQGIFLESERDLEDDREPARAFGVTLDLRVWDR